MKARRRLSTDWRRSQILLTRRSLLNCTLLFIAGLVFSLVLAACSPANNSNGASSAVSSTPASALRIGYQKSATALNLLKSRGDLEKRLQGDGIAVEWSEFVAGPQMLEALNVGSIDFAYTGETPPVFAQAANAPLSYVAFEPLGPKAEAILVQQDSPIQTVADLKGKRVALNKGSNVHYLLVRALEDAGLNYSDIVTVFLPPGDARPAFERGSVDAWVIWDPFMAAAEESIGARVLVDGTGLVENRGFFLATQTFVSERPELLKILLDELSKVSKWAEQNPSEVAGFLAKELGIEKAALERAEQRRGYGVLPISQQVAADQQKIADAFYGLNLIPQEIKIADSVWSSGS